MDQADSPVISDEGLVYYPNSIFCLTPSKVCSGGLIYAKPETPSTARFHFAPLPNLAVEMLLILLTSRLLHSVLSRFHQPLFVSQILGGMLLGFPFLNRDTPYPIGLCDYVFTFEGMRLLDVLAHFSSMFFLFKVGVQMDVKMLKTSGMRTYALGFSCYLCSFIFGEALSDMLKNDDIKELVEVNTNGGFRGSSRIVDLFSLVSFPVIACVLTDLNILNTNPGRLALHVSMVANFLHIVGQSAIIIQDSYSATPTQELYALSVLVGLFIYICFIVRPATLWIVKNTPEGRPVKQSYISLIMASVLLCGLAGKYCGLYITDGAFFLGLAIPDGPPLGTTIVDKLDYMITTFLMPLHMGLLGLKTRIRKLHLEVYWRAGIVIIGCTLGKIIGIFIPALFLGVSIQDSFLLGLIMNLKGIVEVSILNMWIDAKSATDLVDNGHVENSVMVLAVVLIAAIITPMVKCLYDPSETYVANKRRSILQSKENSTDFRILVCVHNQDDVPDIIRLLEACNPTKFNLLTVYILHLVELVGRASPLLIAHPRHRSTSSSNTSKSERIVNAFQQFEDRYHNFVTVQGFTTISPYASMHNDICTMSVDKRTALLIFPFWRQDTVGFREDLARLNISNRAIKTLLQNLLRNSPCSVGILVHGNNYHAQSTCFLPSMPYRIVVLFFGGPDDREALAFVMNMIYQPSVFVTLVRFCGQESLASDEVTEYYTESISIERNKLLDDESVHHFRNNIMDDETVMYKEVKVKDGEETVWAVGSLHEDFDLMVVGRRQIIDTNMFSGLNTDWADERKELGVIADMVTSPDYDAKGSILIIHQQKDIIVPTVCSGGGSGEWEGLLA